MHCSGSAFYLWTSTGCKEITSVSPKLPQFPAKLIGDRELYPTASLSRLLDQAGQGLVRKIKKT